MVTVNAPSDAPVPAKKPAGDNRMKMLEATMKRHQYRPDALIEVLHTAQQLFGYLEEPVLLHIAHSLMVPPSRVYGVATFYHFFSLKPQGKHTCVVCLGTACYVKGSGDIINAVAEYAGIKPGETTPDGLLSLSGARCVGACGIAPVVVLDGQVTGNTTKEAIMETVKGWFENGS